MPSSDSILLVHRGAGGDDHLYWARGDADANGNLTFTGDHEFDQGNRSGSGVGLAWYNGTLFCVHPGSQDSALWWCTWTGHGFTEDQRFPMDNRADCTPALKVWENKLFCVHKGGASRDEFLYYTTWDDAQGHWNEDVRFQNDCRTGAGPWVTQLGGTTYCFFRGRSSLEDNTIYYSRWTAPSWGPQTALSTNLGRPDVGAGWIGPQTYSTPSAIDWNGTWILAHRGRKFTNHLPASNDTHLWTSTFGNGTQPWNGGTLSLNSPDKMSQNLAADGPVLFPWRNTLSYIHRGDDEHIWYGHWNSADLSLSQETMIPGSGIRYEPAIVRETP